MSIDYLQKILTARVYDVAIESPLDLLERQPGQAAHRRQILHLRAVAPPGMRQVVDLLRHPLNRKLQTFAQRFNERQLLRHLFQKLHHRFMVR